MATNSNVVSDSQALKPLRGLVPMATNPDAQDVLFYLYAPDVAAYRNELAARGVKVSALSYPEYAVAGELGMSDPDGYCLLVGQGD